MPSSPLWFLLIVRREGITIVFDRVVLSVLLVSAVIVAWTDTEQHRIPNALTLPMITSGMIYHGVVSGIAGVYDAGIGVLTGAGIFLIPVMIGVMGAGDLKLLMAWGAWGGWSVLLSALFYGFTMLGIIASLVWMIDMATKAESRAWFKQIALAVTTQNTRLLTYPPKSRLWLPVGTLLSGGMVCLMFRASGGF